MKKIIKVTNGKLTGSELAYTLYIRLSHMEAQRIRELAIVASALRRLDSHGLLYQPSESWVVAEAHDYVEDYEGEVILLETLMENEKPTQGCNNIYMQLCNPEWCIFGGTDEEDDHYTWENGWTEIIQDTLAIWKD